MAYCTQSQLESRIPPARMIEALDDNGDGEQDSGLWEKVEAAIAQEIDGILGQRYAVPFAPVPFAVALAAQALCADALFRRRGITDELNPWAKEAREVRARLQRMATGKEPLEATLAARNAPISVISEDSRLYSVNDDAMV